MTDIHKLVDVADMYDHEGDNPRPEDFEFDQVDDLMDMIATWRAAQRHVRAARRVLDAAAQQVAELLGDGGSIRVGDDLVRYKPKRSEQCIDPHAVAELLTKQIIDGDLQVIDIVNPQYVKRTAISGAVRDTFYEWVDDAPALQVVPMSKAPLWAQGLNDGDISISGTHGLSKPEIDTL